MSEETWTERQIRAIKENYVGYSLQQLRLELITERNILRDLNHVDSGAGFDDIMDQENICAAIQEMINDLP